jgi:hypothetical protein
MPSRSRPAAATLSPKELKVSASLLAGVLGFWAVLAVFPDLGHALTRLVNTHSILGAVVGFGSIGLVGLVLFPLMNWIVERIGPTRSEQGLGIALAALALVGGISFLPDPNLRKTGWAFIAGAVFLVFPKNLSDARSLIPVAGAAAIGGGVLCVVAFFVWSDLPMAEVAGAVGLAGAVLYKLLRTDFTFLGQQVQSQVASEWRGVAGRRVITGLTVLVVGIVLLTFCHQQMTASPRLVTETQRELLDIAGAISTVIGLWKLVRGGFSLLGSLIPGPQKPGPTDVANQKVHGDARYEDDAWRIDAALRDEDFGGSPPRFKD